MNYVFYKKYKRLSGMNVTKQIESFFEENEEPLNDRQKYLLKREWGDDRGNYGDLNLPFQAYEWEKVEYTGNTFVRLTFPIFLILIILLSFVIRPIHWLFTGSWWFKEKWGIEKFLCKWWIKIAGE
jgi:hypothetical protein